MITMAVIFCITIIIFPWQLPPHWLIIEYDNHDHHRNNNHQDDHHQSPSSSSLAPWQVLTTRWALTNCTSAKLNHPLSWWLWWWWYTKINMKTILMMMTIIMMTMSMSLSKGIKMNPGYFAMDICICCFTLASVQMQLQKQLNLYCHLKLHSTPYGVSTFCC